MKVLRPLVREPLVYRIIKFPLAHADEHISSVTQRSSFIIILQILI